MTQEKPRFMNCLALTCLAIKTIGPVGGGRKGKGKEKRRTGDTTPHHDMITVASH